MGDGLKLSKDKRHRSSSSIAAGLVEGTRSERKIDVRASIPEVDDHFVIAESRCDDLQDKIDLVKLLKKKKKFKKRSTTRLAEAPVHVEHVPVISVRTQPKKKVSQQAARLRRLEVTPNPTRGYLDPATVEQHDMLGHVRGYNQMYRQLQDQNKNKQPVVEQKSPSRPQPPRRSCAEGDGVRGQGVQISTNMSSQDVACGDFIGDEYSDSENYNRRHNECSMHNRKKQLQQPKKSTQARGRNEPFKNVLQKSASPQKWSEWKQDESRQVNRDEAYSPQKNRRTGSGNLINIDLQRAEERPVVELFNKSRDSHSPMSWLKQNPQPPASPDKKNRKGQKPQRFNDEEIAPSHEPTPLNSRKEKEASRRPRRVKYRSRRYELPTVASQMKQAGMRCYYGTANHTNIPFIVSKSTAPSHNIGVNIQQVLNGLKIQQPLSGIPLTIAHHMGLGHVPSYGMKSVTTQPSLDNREINAIRLGPRVVRLPSYKCMSYSRMLALYRQGEGMVPRFLRAISRPQYFYTSMYNLMSNREDMDGATSKGRAGSQDAKASLAEYASLYREYEKLERTLNENYDPELDRMKDALAKQLAAREDHIRKVVEEFHTPPEVEQSGLRASASTAEDAYRHSTYKLNTDEPHP